MTVWEKACWRHSHLLKIRFGKIITIHEAENNICKCFPYVIAYLLILSIQWHSPYIFRTRLAHIRECVFFFYYGFGWKWQKFVASYIAIQSFVAGINVAIQLSLRVCFFLFHTVFSLLWMFCYFMSIIPLMLSTYVRQTLNQAIN